MKPKPQKIDDGLVIVFEGIDGVGKTTQLGMAADALKAANWPVHTTRNLGGTPIGEKLREVILSSLERPAETNLHISVAIQEALLVALAAERAAGKIILMDRGPLSLAAYEIYGSGLDEKTGWRYVADGMDRLKPELTIVYSTDLQTAAQRSKQKQAHADYFESKPDSYFKRVASGYLTAAERYPDSTVVIDAYQSIDLVHDQTMMAIQTALQAKF